jgi:glycosyltransferase involved in cell wall biosynthesis
MTDDQTTAVDISVVIPVLNEAESLETLQAKLGAVLAGLGRSYEIIFVDDGSTDQSPTTLEGLCCGDAHVKVIQFRRNFGKSAALTAGFAEARGQVVVTMDADLQDDPEELPRLLGLLDQGYDLVSGWKFPRLDPLSKTLPSAFFNWTTRQLTGVPLHDFNCGFKAYRQAVVRELSIYGELYRYIPALAHGRGFKVTEVQVRHHPRRYGSSKYGWSRLLRGPFDLLTVLFMAQYNRRPLHLFGSFGVLCFLGGLVINLYLTGLWLDGVRPIGTRPLLSLGVLLLFMGVQFVSFGLLAEMMAKVSSSNRDDYSVKRRLP